MSIKWKNSKKLKPEIILKKIDSLKTINNKKQMSFVGQEYFECMQILQNMISFPNKTNDIDIGNILSKAVNNVAKQHELSKENVLKEVNSIVRDNLATKEEKYHILTSLCIGKPYPQKIIKIEDSTIRLLDFSYPKKYIKSRIKIINENYEIQDETPINYSKVIITVKAKSIKSALNKALRALDIQRSIWCFFGNVSMEFIGNEWSPINKIRLGKIHTIHKDNGQIATTDSFWYEPNFVKQNIFTPFNKKVFAHNTKWAIAAINKNLYGETIKDALLRFVRALDERDPNIALIKLWGAVESLVCPSNANYEFLTRRVSFLFADKEHHKQVLEYLRDIRNRNIHAGEEIEAAKSNCFKLQYYFYHLVLFHLRNTGQFLTLQEVNIFLDSSSNIKDLERKIFLSKKAIKFISPKE